MKVVQQAESKDKIYIGIIILLLASLGYLFLQSQQTTVPRVADNVKEIYSLLIEREAGIMGVKEESGLYKVTVKYPDARGQNVIQDVYLTKDGTLMTNPLFPNALVMVNETKQGLNAAKNFAECLRSKNFLVFGQSNDVSSLQQLLGFYAYKIYVDCGGQNQQLCQDRNVTQTPMTVYNNTAYRGLPTARDAVTLTGCSL